MKGLRSWSNKIQKYKKKTKTDDTCLLSPHPYPPIICNNSTMDMVFLVQMGESNKCGTVRNDNQLRFGICCGPLYQHPLPPARHQPKRINHEKTKNPEMRSNFQKIISYCLGLCTQNWALRDLDLEPGSKTASETRSTLRNKKEIPKRKQDVL